MKKNSTLIYFVNNFKSEKKTCKKVENKSNFALLAKMDFEPSERSIENILNFARSYEVLETESSGYVEMNLN